MNQRKAKKRLQRRINAFTYFMSRSSESGVQKRKDSGGYKCPGSYRR